MRGVTNAAGLHKGYDDHKLINRLWDQHQIKPIIAIRNCWQDGEADDDGVVTKLVSGQQNEKESIRVGPANSERWPLPAWPGPSRIGLIELNRAPMGIRLPVWWCR